ncbi:hypothetical protein LOC67_14710 [Stieleria sp. JC731]|uniref:hypothetical protein n=1 Tax=Pirellulaceae TaxID=2691357 RepID=UPI001E57DC19|nr:hypothetical protein [Stieleria sp. JC731]MCC9601809.1 hypothetical protein [Stieleria sp. JC731]
MNAEAQQRTKWSYVVVFIAVVLIFLLWICFAAGRVLTGQAPWGPRIGGILPNGTEVYFQARPAGFETDDRLTVIAPNQAPVHYWVDQVHGGFEHVTLKYNNTGNQLWVECDGTVGSSIDLMTNDFRAESDTQHNWAAYGTGTTLDSGNTSTILSILRPW